MRRKLGRTLLIAAAVCVGLMTAGCGKKDAPAAGSAAGSFTDGRDGQTYKTVKIGDQTWMAANLNYRTESGSWCYESDDSKCAQYGRLYDWETAKTVCPIGWMLPDTTDWNTLAQTVGSNQRQYWDEGSFFVSWDGAGKKLKSKNGWNKNGNGTDDYGFSALPGGSSNFDKAGDYGYWWTATETEGGHAAHRREMDYSNDMYGSDHDGNSKGVGLSVRCLMGAPQPEKSGAGQVSKDAEQLTDDRDGQKYKTVKIGDQTWMAENLNYQTKSGSWCYENKADNCKQYGRLYDWNAAMAACPKGWHLPANDDWTELVTAAGSSGVSDKLKSKSGWGEQGEGSAGNGTDDYGFSALPGGYRDSRNGTFSYAGDGGGGYWWTATENGNGNAYHRGIDYINGVNASENYEEKSRGFSVRCLMGAKPPEKTGQEPGSKDAEQFTDNRDGQKYRTVKIGPQTWMAQNLNYQIGSSWCYDNDNSNCEKYGRLYGWNTAMVACPAGWKLPDTADWIKLVTAAGGKNAAGKKLKAGSGWNENANGTDDFGFSALPGGNRRHDGGFSNAGYNGDWWTATNDSFSGGAYSRNMAYDNDNVSEDYNAPGLGFSVRCIKE
jgi:uncharacterized protein (TIGR02145 family)